jgi:hypothetical protein
MAIKPISIPGFSGVDNVHSPDARTFQPPGEMEKRLPALVAATDVDLDDDGWPSSRRGTSELAELTSGLGGFSGNGLLLVQEAGTISVIDTTTDPVTATPLITGLDAADPIRFHEFEGQIWWCNKEHCGRITADGTATNWGQQIPSTPTLGTTAGSLPAGRYIVAVTTLDANGIESGCLLGAAIALNGSQAITVDLTTYDPNAVSARIYVGKYDSAGPGALLHEATTAIGDLPATVSTLGNSKYPLKSQLLRGPVPARTLGSYKGMLLLGRNQWVMPSSGLSHHLFRVGTEALMFTAAVQGIVGLSAGIWVATEGGLFWVAGETLPTMRRVLVDSEYYARHGFAVDGYKLPFLQTDGQVAVFVSRHGIVFGLPSGQAVVPQQDTYRLGDVVGKRLSLAYQMGDDLRQLFLLLTTAVAEDGAYWGDTETSPPFGGGSLLVDSNWTVRHASANTTANNLDFIVVDAAGLRITLPAAPAAKYAVAVSVGAFTNTIVDGNGNDILESGADFTINVEHATVVLFWPDATKGWVVM